MVGGEERRNGQYGNVGLPVPQRGGQSTRDEARQKARNRDEKDDAIIPGSWADPKGRERLTVEEVVRMDVRETGIVDPARKAAAADIGALLSKRREHGGKSGSDRDRKKHTCGRNGDDYRFPFAPQKKRQACADRELRFDAARGSEKDSA